MNNDNRPEYSVLHLNRMPSWDFWFNVQSIDPREWSELDQLVETHECSGCMELPLNGFKDKYNWCKLSRMIAAHQDINVCMTVPRFAENPFNELPVLR